MAVIPDFRAVTLLAFLREHVAPGSTVYTDGRKCYAGLEGAGYQHVPRIQPLRAPLLKGARSAVPFADRATGNLQQWLIGTYHGVSKGHLQVYLDEFVFRHNRRKQPMAAFQTLLGPGATHQPTAYKQIRGATDISVKTGQVRYHNPLGMPSQADKHEATGRACVPYTLCSEFCMRASFIP